MLSFGCIKLWGAISESIFCCCGKINKHGEATWDWHARTRFLKQRVASSVDVVHHVSLTYEKKPPPPGWRRGNRLWTVWRRPFGRTFPLNSTLLSASDWWGVRGPRALPQPPASFSKTLPLPQLQPSSVPGESSPLTTATLWYINQRDTERAVHTWVYM